MEAEEHNFYDASLNCYKSIKYVELWIYGRLRSTNWWWKGKHLVKSINKFRSFAGFFVKRGFMKRMEIHLKVFKDLRWSHKKTTQRTTDSQTRSFQFVKAHKTFHFKNFPSHFSGYAFKQVACLHNSAPFARSAMTLNIFLSSSASNRLSIFSHCSLFVGFFCLFEIHSRLSIHDPSPHILQSLILPSYIRLSFLVLTQFSSPLFAPLKPRHNLWCTRSKWYHYFSNIIFHPS